MSSDGSKPLAAKKEAFCQAYAKQPANAKNASAAYRATRNCTRMQTATINSNAKKLLRETPVRLRIAAIELERECSADVQVAENVPQDSGLKLEEEKFCQHYALNPNGAAAVLSTWPSTSRLKPQGRAERASKLLAQPKIKARVAALRAKVQQAAETKFDVTKDRVLQGLAELAFFNMADVMSFDQDGRPFLDLSRMTRAQAAAFTELSSETVSRKVEDLEDVPEGTEAAAKHVSVVKAKVKVADKRAALVDLGKHLGLFKNELEVTHKGEVTFESRMRNAIRRVKGDADGGHSGAPAVVVKG